MGSYVWCEEFAQKWVYCSCLWKLYNPKTLLLLFLFFFFDTLLTSETVLLGLSQRLPFGLFLLMPASGCGTDLPLVQSRSFFPPHRESWGHSASVPDLSMVLILENFPGIMYFPTKSLRSSPGLWTSCPSPAWLRRTHNWPPGGLKTVSRWKSRVCRWFAVSQSCRARYSLLWRGKTISVWWSSA